MLDNMDVKYSFASSKDLQLASTPRNPYSSKRSNGKLLIVGGSEKYHGAPALASNAAYMVLAAMRIGIGYATEFVPKRNLRETRAVSPDIIVRPLAGSHMTLADIPALTKSLDNSECLVVGPGIGLADQTLRAAIELFNYAKRNGKRVVVDADSIHALVKYRIRLNKNFIITPNKGEFNLFYKKKLGDDDLHARANAAIEVSKMLNANVLLKGHDTVVTDGKRVKVIRAKSSALAVMGTGDVLAGIIGGYATRNRDVFIAGVAGAYLQTHIGDTLHKEKGNHILASDVVDRIPTALKKFDRNGSYVS
jgi:ADP-dependent NAD(P)H-hydrate dehydratase / NAD(P)H-hydrate epimerase